MNTEFTSENVHQHKMKVAKPTVFWYASPLFLGIFGSAIMWYFLRDIESAKEMRQQGWIVGIVLTLVGLAWVPIIMGLNAN